MGWNINHFRREYFYWRHAVLGEAADAWRFAMLDDSLSAWDRTVLASDIFMEIVCDSIEAFHYTIGHALVYGGLAWSCYSLFRALF